MGNFLKLLKELFFSKEFKELLKTLLIWVPIILACGALNVLLIYRGVPPDFIKGVFICTFITMSGVFLLFLFKCFLYFVMWFVCIFPKEARKGPGVDWRPY